MIMNIMKKMEENKFTVTKAHKENTIRGLTKEEYEKKMKSIHKKTGI